MTSSRTESKVVRVSQKGQATVPKGLREKFRIERLGEVFVYEERERIIIEPVPSPDDLHGIYAGEHEPGEVIERVCEMKEKKVKKRCEWSDSAHLKTDERPVCLRH